MTIRLKALPRTAALSVAITLLVSPVASAQSPDAAPPNLAQANTTLLNNVAFARLVQPAPAATVPAPVVADAPRPSLLRQGTAAMARQAQAAPAPAPKQRSWVSRHTWASSSPPSSQVRLSAA
jgi:hypothetical protein